MVNEALSFLLHNLWSESADIHVRNINASAGAWFP